ncbi:MAG TPA: glycosyltransferase [Cyclobacteriaceae bacterium]|nr:glycosyltransferase [Cyclobacteriaceae bacterium]HMV11197.1 glycosyltransferase [Cyclobacteriaceae bacterium]HMV91676.1 glycosyltransferase [Cyclobacteriaceae bacterium]HMX01711.1 glycosyltransferase [Cyclobacteriaceae bacterium]HMX51388.1 glycosyltransferase [Cyclobacteriaceae bacterium]
MQLYATSVESYNPLKVNVCSETALLKMRGEGVNTAFVECAELLKEQPDVDVIINSEGHGDIMHSHTYGPYFFLKGLFYPKRKILTVHVIPDSIKGSLPFAKQVMPFVRWYFKQVYSFADVLIAISPMVEEAIRELGVTTRIVRMANPLQINKWKRTEALRKKGREILGLKDGEFCVMDVGQLQARKGPEDFIDIAGKLPHIQFRWIGGRPFGAITEGVKRLNTKIDNAPPNVKFAGLFSLEEMPALYAAADAFVFLSYQENSPLAPVEAAASGMPVMYRDLREYRLLYRNAYYKGHTHEDFAQWIKRLASDKEFYEHSAQVSAQLITQFEKETIRKQLIGLYKEVIERAQSTRSKRVEVTLGQS